MKEPDLAVVETIRIFRREAPVKVLGPGARAVVWVQGCPFACRNCIVPESWDAAGGESVEIAELAQWILEQPEIEGVTYSGGEPMEQADALAELTDQLGAKRDLGVVCYTGYTWEHLQAKGTPGQRALLERIDLLIDGVYIESRHADRLWRGSANQRLLPLSDRYRGLIESLSPEQDRSAGMEFSMKESGLVAYAGVPAMPGFRSQFESLLYARGIQLTVRKE